MSLQKGPLARRCQRWIDENAPSPRNREISVSEVRQIADVNVYELAQVEMQRPRACERAKTRRKLGSQVGEVLAARHGLTGRFLFCCLIRIHVENRIWPQSVFSEVARMTS